MHMESKMAEMEHKTGKCYSCPLMEGLNTTITQLLNDNYGGKHDQ